MILAVSRFRVVNGTEREVAAAFLNRPRLVDSWPGFLGLETFRDVEQPSVFYLVTRWTDAASFRAWHSSPAHRASHAWMPGGLRLDPGFTRLVELERLRSADETDLFNLTVDAAALIGAFLRTTRTIHLLRLGLDGTVLFANEAVVEALGVDASRFTGMPIFPYLTETDGHLMRRILGGERALEDAVSLNFCDSEGQPLTLACHVQRTPHGCVLLGDPMPEHDRRLQHRLLAMNEELAVLARERHRATTDEHEARRAAEMANRIKDEALAVIAHEMRQPLNAATMALSLLDARPEASERVRATLRRQLTQMTKLVDDLLDASRVIRGTIELHKQRVDLRRITDDCVEAVRAAAEQRQQRLAVSQGPDAIEIEVDVARFSQVLSNVLTNASKYTPIGGSITVVVEREAGEGVVRVFDTGEGIAGDALSHLFDLFVRASGEAGGLGIGLAVTRRLVEMHGGSVEARSEGPGRGAEFILRWPLAARAAAPDAAGGSLQQETY